jgi:hypothetical protein
MGEARVAFPNDETSAEVMASRLRHAGIAARVDRGLYASYQAAPRNQITVLVDERHAKRARELLGTSQAERPSSEALLRAAVVVVVVAIALGVVVIGVLLTR